MDLTIPRAIILILRYLARAGARIRIQDVDGFLPAKNIHVFIADLDLNKDQSVKLEKVTVERGEGGAVIKRDGDIIYRLF